MAFEYLEGFSGIATADLTGGPAPIFSSLSGSVSVDTAVTRWGDRSLKFNAASAYVERTGLANVAKRAIAFAFYSTNLASASNTIGNVALGDGSSVYTGTQNSQVGITFENDGKIAAYRNRGVNGATLGTFLGRSAASHLVSNTWQHIQIVVEAHDSAGTVDVFVGGVLALSLTGQDTKQTATAQINSFALQSNGGGAQYVSDLVSIGYTGGTITSIVGDVRIGAVLPNGAGDNTDFTPSTGSNWQNVDDATQDGDGTRNESTGVGDRDDYAIPSFSITGTIFAVKIDSVLKKTDAATCDAQNYLRISGANFDQTQRAASTSYGIHGDVLELDPATASAFTTGSLAATKIGVKRAA